MNAKATYVYRIFYADGRKETTRSKAKALAAMDQLGRGSVKMVLCSKVPTARRPAKGGRGKK